GRETCAAARRSGPRVAAGKRVGVTANSHKVIANALDKVQEAAIQAGTPVRIGQRTGQEDDAVSPHARPVKANPEAAAALRDNELDVLGGTAWLWSREEMEGAV